MTDSPKDRAEELLRMVIRDKAGIGLMVLFAGVGFGLLAVLP